MSRRYAIFNVGAGLYYAVDRMHPVPLEDATRFIHEGDARAVADNLKIETEVHGVAIEAKFISLDLRQR